MPTQETEPFEVDHVFVSVSRGGEEADRLVGWGFEEGPPNTHPGQGTACRRFYFENAYLELAWLEDEHEASSPGVDRLGLVQRMGRVRGASRLGVAMRPTGPVRDPLPFAVWTYEPPYLEGGRSVPVATSSRLLGEPLLFFLPWEREWTAPVLPHPNGAGVVTRISMTVAPGRSVSPALQWLHESERVHVEVGSSELFTLELDRGRQGESGTLGPGAPLRLVW
jgi:hypothetical protein